MSTVLNKPATTNTDPVIVQPEPERSNLIGLIALGLAIIGLVFAALLLTAGIAWMLLLPAIGLAVVGLTRKNRRKGTSLAALIVAIVALILSFVGFRLPMGVGGVDGGPDGGPGILNNSGVNPFSVLLPGGGTNTGSEGEVGGETVEAGDGLVVGVSSVDCHQPLATVTGLNITGEVCAVTIDVTNNGTGVISLDSSNVTANVDGTGYLADPGLAEGDLLSVDVATGESVTGTVYVNLPSGSGDIDSLTVSGGTGSGSVVTVDLDG
jgi:hypothetical protein